MCWECPSVEFHTQNQSGQSQAGNYQEAGKSTPVERNCAMVSKACKKNTIPLFNGALSHNSNANDCNIVNQSPLGLHKVILHSSHI